jgi:tight adherence protein C
MTLIIALALFLFLMAAISGFAWFVYMRPARVLDNIAAAGPSSTGPRNTPGTQGGFTTVLQWVGQKAPQSVHESGITRRLLSAAGFTSDVALPIYAGIRLLAMGCLGLFVFFVLDWFRVALIMRLGGGVLAGFLGGMVCSIVLEELVKRRRERIRLGLPDALDLLVVCVESGLGLDQAIRVVCDELTIAHPDLSRELSLVSLEMRAGVTRAAALRNFAERTAEDEIRKFTAVLIQTDRFGTSLAESLRTHAKFLRTRRRHEAEERAGKIGVKLTFPIFFLMLPSIVVVAVGPAALRVFKEVLPALRNSGLSH